MLSKLPNNWEIERKSGTIRAFYGNRMQALKSHLHELIQPPSFCSNHPITLRSGSPRYHRVSEPITNACLVEANILPFPDHTDSTSSKRVERIAIRYLKKQQQQTRRTLKKEQQRVSTLSQALEVAVADAIAERIIENRSSVVGPNDEHTGAGMSQRTQILDGSTFDDSYYTIPTVHKNLYDADVLLQQARARQEAIAAHLKNPVPLIKTIAGQSAAFPATPIQNDWVKQQVEALLY